MKYSLSLIIAIAAFLTVPNAFAQFFAESFSRVTRDGLTQIHGEIDFPTKARSSSKLPAVVLVGGTGLFDRDYNFGVSNTDDDLLFKVLTSYYAKAGYAVIRYDYRGVSCNQRTAPQCHSCKTAEESYDVYYKSCIDPKVRAAVTPQNIREDILTVYEFALSNSHIDPKRILILAHSEGTVHVSDLVGKKLLKPAGLLMLGMVAESPKDIIHWQGVVREVDAIMKHDSNGDGLIDATERKMYCEDEKWSEWICNEFLPQTQILSRENIKDGFENRRQKAVAQLLLAPDADPFPSPSKPMASMAWWKMFFTDMDRPMDKLFQFNGKISFNNGDIDTQTPGERELGLIRENVKSFLNQPHINLYEGVGHGFGENGTMGPMKPESIYSILNETRWLLENP